jgi:hypothetical protein
MGKLRTPAEIEAEIAVARASLAAGVVALLDQVRPKAVAQRGLKQAQSIVGEKIAPLKREVIADDGSWRTDRIAMVAAGFASLVILVSVLRKIFKR